MAAHRGRDIGVHGIHLLQQGGQNVAGSLLTAAHDRNGQQVGVRVRRNGHQLPQVALLHVELLSHLTQGRTVSQQGSVGGKDRIGAVRILVGHAGLDLIIGGHIEVGLCHPDIVGVQIVPDGILSVLLCFLDGVFGIALAFFVVGNVERILLFGSLVTLFFAVVLGQLAFVGFLGILRDRPAPCGVCPGGRAKNDRAGQGGGKDLPVFAQERESERHKVDLVFLPVRRLVFHHVLFLLVSCVGNGLCSLTSCGDRRHTISTYKISWKLPDCKGKSALFN